MRKHVDRNPHRKHTQMDSNKRQAANKPGNPIDDPFGLGSLLEKLLLVPCNQLDLFLDVALRHRTPSLGS